RNVRRLVALTLCGLLAACATPFRDPEAPIASHPGFEVSRFLGTWYEIARFPVEYLEGCYGTTMTYEARDESGGLRLTYRCRNSGFDGPVQQVRGTARETETGQLQVWFVNNPALPTRQTVLWVDKGYQVAAIGVPDGRTGWILARSREISAAQRAEAEQALLKNGYDLSRLVTVPQVEKSGPDAPTR
ncbi:MAG: lipocalin family protein, partial [Pseudomonadota bacterium]